MQITRISSTRISKRFICILCVLLCVYVCVDDDNEDYENDEDENDHHPSSAAV